MTVSLLRQWYLRLLLILVVALTVDPAIAEEIPAARPGCSSKPCSLHETLVLAVEGHALVRAARGGLEVFEARLKAARHGWVPSFSATGSVTGLPRKWGDPMDGGTDYSIESWRPWVRGELNATMPIYTFGKISTLKKMARAGIDVGKAQVHIARSHVEGMAVEAYYTLQMAHQMADLLEEGEGYLKRVREYLEDLRDRDDEAFDDVDMLRLKIYESDVAGYRLDARRAEELAYRGLELLTGLERDSFQPPSKLVSLKVVLQPKDKYVASAMTNRGELMALAGAIQAQRLQVSLEKRNFFPDFFLGATVRGGRAWSVERQDSPFANEPYNSSYFGGAVGLQWKLDTTRRILALDEARAGKRRILARYEALEQQVIMEVETAYAELLDLKKKLNLTYKAYKAARGWVIARLDTYESGFGTFRDVGDGLGAFFRQRIAWAQVQLEYNVGLAKLAHACGLQLQDIASIE